MSLHVVAVNTAGEIRHTIRQADGVWQPFLGDIESQTGNAGHFTDSDCTLDTANNLHVCGVTNNGLLFHTRRNANGAWISPFTNVSSVLGFSSSVVFKRISCTFLNGVLHVWGVYDTGTTLPQRNIGFWGILNQDNTWENISSAVSWEFSRLTDVSCMVVHDQVQLIGLRNVALPNSVRSELIMSQPFGSVVLETFVPRLPKLIPHLPDSQQPLNYIERISSASEVFDIHLGFVTNTGRIYHLQKNVDLIARNIENHTGESGTFADIGFGKIGSEIHVVATTTNFNILHTFRTGQGAWQRFFGNIEIATSEAGQFITAGAS